MNEELLRFKAFVAAMDSDDEVELAAQLGEAKALWGEAALSLGCVRQAVRYNQLDEPTRQRGQDLLRSLGLVRKVERRF